MFTKPPINPGWPQRTILFDEGTENGANPAYIRDEIKLLFRIKFVVLCWEKWRKIGKNKWKWKKHKIKFMKMRMRTKRKAFYLFFILLFPFICSPVHRFTSNPHLIVCAGWAGFEFRAVNGRYHGEEKAPTMRRENETEMLERVEKARNSFRIHSAENTTPHFPINTRKNGRYKDEMMFIRNHKEI